MDSQAWIDLLKVLVPVVVSAVVAIVTSRQTQDLRDLVSLNQKRIAVLEQILIDHGIPVPAPDTTQAHTIKR